MFDVSFYKGKRVLVTGHTGFKGTWLCSMLVKFGAEVTGYALTTPTNPALFNLACIGEDVHSVVGDIRDRTKLQQTFEESRPEIVIHMAAQPIVRESYRNPVETYEVNVMGTTNVLECIRNTESVKSFLNVTTDKVYKNKEWEWGYRETDELCGHDPYSNSKSCSEMVTYSYRVSFLDKKDRPVAVSTARAGNVIGGGDFATDRIVPDCVRAAMAREDILVRNPDSVRPFQHVLDPLYAYLMIAAGQYEDLSCQGSYNVGPETSGCIAAGDLVDDFVKVWGDGLTWVSQPDHGPHESNILKLDCSRLKKRFGWHPVWDVHTAIGKTVEWTKCWLSGGDVRDCMDNQIMEFLEKWKKDE